MPRFEAHHCTFSNSRGDNFLGNFSKTSDAYFKLTSDIFLKSARLKNQQRKPLCKTMENMIFLYCFNNFNQNSGWRDRFPCFIGKLCKEVPGKSEHKLEAAVPVLCWYFFNLNEKTIVKKKILYLF